MSFFLPKTSPMALSVAVLLSLPMTAPSLAQAAATYPYHWVQLIAGGKGKNDMLLPKASVRAIVQSGTPCPTLYTKPGNIPLVAVTDRQPPPNFGAITLCEATLDPTKSDDAKYLSAFTPAWFNPGMSGKQDILLPNLTQGAPISRLVTFGCTGCRDNSAKQTCDDQSWPFAQVNQDAAAKTADGIPPLVVHTGDIRYAFQGGDNAADDTWDSGDNANAFGWKQEFFDPVNDLMANGYWVVLRGNHDSCMVGTTPPSQDGDKCNQVDKKDYTPELEWLCTPQKDRAAAWLYFFAFSGQVTNCTDLYTKNGDVQDPYAFDATFYGAGAPDQAKASNNHVRLVFMDTVRTGDDRDREQAWSVSHYQKRFDLVDKQFIDTLPKKQTAWLFTHIPVYNVKVDKSKGDKSKGELHDHVLMDALDSSSLKGDFDNFSVSMSAHLHQFELVARHDQVPTDKGGPIQYIVGNAGVELSDPDQPVNEPKIDVSWTPIGSSKATSPTTWSDAQRLGFGYLLVDATQHNQVAFTPMLHGDNGASPWATADSSVTCTAKLDALDKLSCPTLKDK